MDPVPRRWPKVLPDDIRERDELALDNAAVLVRGGQFRIAHVLARAEACDRRLGFPGVSVAHAVTGRLTDLCKLSPRLLDYDECAVTTAGRVRQHFAIAPTGASPHFSIILPSAEMASVRLLRDLFEVGLPLPPADWPR